ncbi:hypothetical protein ACRS1R_20120 [Aeromonas dhakensis]|uniref:hypothetical protein n=1 Tax=Aeromonas dhakensis TaxID=196024 RepID=UPI003EDEEA01
MAEKIDEVLSAPVMQEQTDTERKLKNNLIAFSVISIFMYYGDLSISSESTFLGLKFSGLDQQKIYIGLFVFIVYAAIHYIWYVQDSIVNWRLRCTAISELRPIRYNSPAGSFELKDKKNNTLYHWWNYTKLYIDEQYIIDEALIKTIEALENKALGESYDDHVSMLAILNDAKKSVAESQKAIKELSETLISEPFSLALPRFNKAFSYFLVSQNIRWMVFECIVPFGLAVLALSLLFNSVKTLFVA